MTNLLRLMFVAAVMVPVAAAAASYKCVVDGRTTYQGQPCSEDVNTRGSATTVIPPSTRANPPSGAPRQETARRDLAKAIDLEPLARDAFAAIKGGNNNAYAALLCPKPRAAFGNKTMAETFQSEGLIYAQAKTELQKTAATDHEGVTFVTTETAGSAASGARGPRMVRVHFDWPDGKPCVTTIETWLKSERK